MIQLLIERGHAYIADKHVFFDIVSDPNYAHIAKRELEEMRLGTRIEIDRRKKHPADFVLWKPEPNHNEVSFDSPWGKGRPGWHIECSAMSTYHLGQSFDIHGGGVDLLFPHHTNEIAQSTCCYGQETFAQYWVHNGFVTINGTKMSKSLGNFITIQDLSDQNIKGEIVRMTLLATHYRKPIDWNDKSHHDAQKTLQYLYKALHMLGDDEAQKTTIPNNILEALQDDLNIPLAIALMRDLAKCAFTETNKTKRNSILSQLYASGQIIGIFDDMTMLHPTNDYEHKEYVNNKIKERKIAKNNKDYTTADLIRTQLVEMGVELEDHSDGSTTWHKK